MTKLGKWQTEHYPLSWVTQRLSNRAPEYTHGRKWSYSIMQQMLNPIALDIQKTFQELTEERNNYFASSANIYLLDHLYTLELGIGMDFKKEERVDGTLQYIPPRVYAVIDGTEYELTSAKENNIETLAYSALPSRVADSEISYDYTAVVPETNANNVSGITPSSFSTPGRARVTIKDNTNWYVEFGDKTFYAKVFIRGTTRQATKLVESIPIQYNGTFKTTHQWVAIEEVWTSYMSEEALITIDVLDFNQESSLDTKNIVVPRTGVESFRFLRLEDKSWGTSLVSEGFTESSMSNIQLGFNAKDIEYQIELLDDAGDNVTLNDMAIHDTFPWILCIDDDNLYVYDSFLLYPDVSKLTPESTNTKMDLHSDRWIYAKDDVASIRTKTLDVASPPYSIRWTLEEPNGDKWYLGVDGSKWALTTNAWIDNVGWDKSVWMEQDMSITLDQRGTYVLTIECMYSGDQGKHNSYTLTTRHLLYTPSLLPEITLSLPASLQNSTLISFDDDGKVWLEKDSKVHRLDLFFDYFLTDYTRKNIMFRENYSSIRVVTE
jgi:hypothetical protein